MAPLVQLTLLGYAATTDVRDVPLVVVDEDRSVESRALVSRFEASQNFVIAASVSSSSGIDGYLDSGAAPGWRSTSRRGTANASATASRCRCRWWPTAATPTPPNVALGYAGSLIAGYNRELAAAAGGGRRRAADASSAQVRVWFNPQLESRFFIIPGVLALLLLVVTTNLSSMAMVREKELGTLEQLNVTPLGALGAHRRQAPALRAHRQHGRAARRGRGGLLVRGAAARQSCAAASSTSLVYLMTTLGLGLFVSTISNTQQQAMMTSSFFFLIPMVFLSGFVFPIENMPDVVQQVTRLIPLRYFLVIVRGIFLKGVGLERAVAADCGAADVGAGNRRPGGRPVAKDAQLTFATVGRRLKKATRLSPSFSSAITRTAGSRTSRSTACTYDGRVPRSSCTTSTVTPRRWSSAMLFVSGNARMS